MTKSPNALIPSKNALAEDIFRALHKEFAKTTPESISKIYLFDETKSL